MADTKYLVRRGRMWYVRVPHPPKEWGLGKTPSGRDKEFVASLNTADLRTAQAVRDRHLVPLLAATSAGRLLETLRQHIEAVGGETGELAAQLRSGLTGVEEEALTLGEARDRWLAFLGRGHSAPTTLSKYRSDLSAVARLLGANTPVAGLTREDAVRLRDTLLSLPPTWQRLPDPPKAAGDGQATLAPQTVGRTLATARSLLEWCAGDGLIPTNASFENVPIPRAVTRSKTCPTREEAGALLRLEIPRDFDELTWRMMPVFARYSACRAGELSQLHAADVVEREGVRCLWIRRSLKTPSSERLVPVADGLAPHLDELLSKRGRGRLFRAGDYTDEKGATKHAHGFLKHYNRRAKDVGDLSFHCWRTYANDAMATAGVDIGDRERILGQKSGRTQAAYTPENLSRLKAAVDTIP